mgnify:CR=1 FL=1
MSFRALVLAALDAAGHAPDSAPGRYALDRAQDVGCVVERAADFAAYYGARRLPRRVDAQDAALSLALLAESETRRGVRTVGAK